MASVVGVCGGLVGPKSEHIEKSVGFKSIFEGAKRAKSMPKKVWDIPSRTGGRRYGEDKLSP